jgi:acetyl esterase/lipase
LSSDHLTAPSIFQETYTYKTVGDCAIQADVYCSAAAHPSPAIIWIHGGALIIGNRGMLGSDELQRYHAAGYTVISIDYRLAPETKLPAIIEDVQDAYRWVYTQGPNLFGIDPARIAVAGNSAGGYLTLMAGFCVTPRPRALVSFYGYGDIAGTWYSRPDPFYCQEPAVTQAEAEQAVGTQVIAASDRGPRGQFYLYCRQQGLWPQAVAGLDPDRHSDAFTPFCPIRNVTAAYPPTLLLHGDQDTDVPCAQSIQMADELQHVGVPHELNILVGHGHSFLRSGQGLQDSTVAQAFAQMLAFLKRHLGE